MLILIMCHPDGDHYQLSNKEFGKEFMDILLKSKFQLEKIDWIQKI